jgi:hypothetical protein
MPNLLKKISRKNKEKTAKASAKPKASEKLFISIILSDQELQSALLSKEQGIKEYSNIKNYFDRQDLLMQLDQSLQDLGPVADDVAECVFIFEDSWLKDDDLLDSKKVVVQEIAEDLSLSAIGQLSISEGIYQARILKDVHDSSITIYLREKDFDLVLIKHGQLLAKLKVGRSDKLSDDLQEGLARISQDLGEQGKYFPNKVFLCTFSLSQKDLKNDQIELQAYDWTQVGGFLQNPEFVLLDQDFLVKSLSLAANYILSNESTTELGVLNTEKSAKETSTSQDSSESELAIANEAAKVSSFGIDLSAEKAVVDQQNKKTVPTSQSEEISALDDEEAEDQTQTNLVGDNLLMDEKKTAVKHFFKKNRKSMKIGIGGGLLVLLALFLFFYLFLSNVTIEITPNQQVLQKNVEIILDPQAEASDFSQNLMKVSLVQKEVSGEDVASTTGVSLVGEKAKGKVELFNKTFTDKTFAAGTSLKYENDDESVLFVLDEEVTVPAAESEEEEKEGERGRVTDIDYGSLEVTVTARDIGAEANIKEDSKLLVANFSEDTYSATAIENFTGGFSREVRVVSPDDLSNLLNQLREELNQIAADEFQAESKDGTYFVPTGNSEIINSQYDYEEGDEIETLSLSMTLEVEAVQYSSDDLKQLAEEVLLLELPENYVFVDEKPSLLSGEPVLMDDDSDRLVLDAELSAKAKANIDSNLIQDLVVGKTVEEAKNNLKEQELIDQAEIIFQPSFMSKFFYKIPKDSARFNLLIK